MNISHDLASACPTNTMSFDYLDTLSLSLRRHWLVFVCWRRSNLPSFRSSSLLWPFSCWLFSSQLVRPLLILYVCALACYCLLNCAFVSSLSRERKGVIICHIVYDLRHTVGSERTVVRNFISCTKERSRQRRQRHQRRPKFQPNPLRVNLLQKAQEVCNQNRFQIASSL